MYTHTHTHIHWFCCCFLFVSYERWMHIKRVWKCSFCEQWFYIWMHKIPNMKLVQQQQIIRTIIDICIWMEASHQLCRSLWFFSVRFRGLGYKLLSLLTMHQAKHLAFKCHRHEKHHHHIWKQDKRTRCSILVHIFATDISWCDNVTRSDLKKGTLWKQLTEPNGKNDSHKRLS